MIIVISLVLLALLIATIFVGKRLYNVYDKNLLIRYANKYAHKWHPEEFSIDDARPTFYYADFSPCLHEYCFNEKGEILYEFETGEVAYHPCMIAEYAIVNAEAYLRTDSEESKAKFKLHADWLLNNLKKDDSGAGAWYYDFNNSVLQMYFYSGISQGVGISALVRAYTIFNDQQYLDAAISSFKWMIRPYSNNGCLYEEGEWKGWIEEDTEGFHILNGHIYAAIGLYDLWRVTRDTAVHQQFENALSVLKQQVHKFDVDYFSKYSQRPGAYCNNSYHLIHVYQFNILHKITKESFYLDYAKRFENQYYSKWKRFQFYLKLVSLAILKR
jgi:hypothetical protein